MLLECFNTIILGDTEQPSGHGPGQPALGDNALAGTLGQMTSRGPLQPQPFCDSGSNSTTKPLDISGMKREKTKNVFTQRFSIKTLRCC